jgi:molecular chaperone GrpE (heat shock protein)
MHYYSTGELKVLENPGRESPYNERIIMLRMSPRMYRLLTLALLVLWAAFYFPEAAQAAGEGISITFRSPRPREKLRWGQPLRVEVEVIRGGVVPQYYEGFYVTALIEFPDRTRENLRLHDDGKKGDYLPQDGVWANTFTTASTPGLYRISIKVWDRDHVCWSEERRAFIYLEPRKPLPWGKILGWTLPFLVILLGIYVWKYHVPMWQRRMEEKRKKRRVEELQKIKIPTDDRAASLMAEVNRYKSELETVKAEIVEEQRAIIFGQLEKMLVQIPTVKKYVEEGQDIPAGDILWLLMPLEKVISDLGFQAIGKIDEVEPYNPDLHQPMKEKETRLLFGEPVRVKFIGFKDDQKIFRRARVVPANEKGNTPDNG